MRSAEDLPLLPQVLDQPLDVTHAATRGSVAAIALNRAAKMIALGALKQLRQLGDLARRDLGVVVLDVPRVVGIQLERLNCGPRRSWCRQGSVPWGSTRSRQHRHACLPPDLKRFRPEGLRARVSRPCAVRGPLPWESAGVPARERANCGGTNGGTQKVFRGKNESGSNRTSKPQEPASQL